ESHRYIPLDDDDLEFQTGLATRQPQHSPKHSPKHSPEQTGTEEQK
ncbi:hypothetical protein MNBD_GAMMA19-1998, partial [hydrothermal vent metagenome]